MPDKNLLIIFIKNLIPGKVKTRLAVTLGNKKALNIYKLLLHHTFEITNKLKCDKVIYYSDEIIYNDEWHQAGYHQKLQQGKELGERMSNAFENTFSKKYKKAVIIGSDCFQLSSGIIQESFNRLEENDVVMGPAKDGGYYLLGLKQMMKELFIHKSWGMSSVLPDTINDVIKSGKTFYLLQELRDVDTEADVPAELLNKLTVNHD